MRTAHLKSCPFCGSKPTMESWHGEGPDSTLIACGNVEGPRLCQVGPQVHGETQALAVRRWNRRVPRRVPYIDFVVEHERACR